MKKVIFFILSLFLFGCNNSNKKESNVVSNTEIKRVNCVKEIFKKDSIYGSIRNHASEKMSPSEAINEYVKHLKLMDYSNCPEAFTLAFHNHIDAWLDFKKVSDKHPSLRGELHAIFEIIEKSEDSTAFKLKLAQILETWQNVEDSSN